MLGTTMAGQIAGDKVMKRFTGRLPRIALAVATLLALGGCYYPPAYYGHPGVVYDNGAYSSGQAYSDGYYDGGPGGYYGGGPGYYYPGYAYGPYYGGYYPWWPVGLSLGFYGGYYYGGHGGHGGHYHGGGGGHHGH
jgi:hypothetical protein